MPTTQPRAERHHNRMQRSHRSLAVTLLALERRVLLSAPVVSFAAADVRVIENEGWARITVVRSGDIDVVASTLLYETHDLTAKARADYVPTAGVLAFSPGDSVKTFSVPLLDDIAFEGDESFSLVMFTPKETTLVERARMTVTIEDNDEAHLAPSDTSAPRVIAYGSNRVGGKVVGLAIRFSEPLNAASAQNAANYAISNAKKGGKASMVQSATYDAADNTVLLRINGWNTTLPAKIVTVKNVVDESGNSLLTSSANLSQSILASLKSPTLGEPWGPPKQWKPLAVVKGPAKGLVLKPAASYTVGALKVDRVDRSDINNSLNPANARAVAARDLTGVKFEFLPSGEFRVRAPSGYLAVGTYSVSKGIATFKGVQPELGYTLFEYRIEGKLAIPAKPGQAAKATVGISCARGDAFTSSFTDYAIAATLSFS